MAIELSSFLLLVLIGLIIGVISSMVGANGGVLYIPVLLSIYGLEPKFAIGTSIFCCVLLSLSSSFGYMQSNNVNWKIALIYNVAGTPGTIMGAWLTTQLPGTLLKYLCIFSLFAIGVVLLFKQSKYDIRMPYLDVEFAEKCLDDPSCIKGYSEKRKRDFRRWRRQCPLAYDFQRILFKKLIDKNENAKPEKWNEKKKLLILISSFVAGLVGGVIGLGSGTIFTSSLLMIGIPFNFAAGSASLGTGIGKIFGAISHWYYGNIIWGFAIPLGFASAFGALIGCRFATHVDGKILKKILGGMALLTAFDLLF